MSAPVACRILVCMDERENDAGSRSVCIRIRMTGFVRLTTGFPVLYHVASTFTIHHGMPMVKAKLEQSCSLRTAEL